MLLALTSCVLLLQGYARSEIGRASTQSDDTSGVVPQMNTVGPVLDLSGDAIRSVSPPVGTVALTFDDGPNGSWTPKVLEVLARYHVPATFFVIGSHAFAHARLVHEEYAAGDEIGNHTFSHVELRGLPAWRLRLELRLTESAIAAATGHHTILFRPPYSSEPSAAGAETLRAWRRVAQQGYLIATATQDAEDWKPNATVDDIVRRATPNGNEGAVILMHDGGGNRARTVAALDRIIPELLARGDRFVTIGDLAHLQRDAVMPVASATERWQSTGLAAAFWTSNKFVDAFTFLAITFVVLMLGRLVVVMLCVPRHRRRLVAVDLGYTPVVTILVPAYNEAAGIEAAVRSLAAQDYRPFEIVVVDDGSTDDTAAIVGRLAGEITSCEIRLVRQANAGKARALNAGLEIAYGEVIVTVDGDTVFTPNALRQLVQPLQDARVGAVSGNTKVGNRNQLLGRWQHLEYVLGFNLDRRMYDMLGCMPTVPGAIGAFRASALAEVGGFSDDTLAEDTDLTMAIHRAGYRVAYEPRAIALTEAPQGLRDLWRQRYRWSYGTMQSVWKHRRAVVETNDVSRLGRLGLPYVVLFQIALPLLGPLVDLFALYGILFLDRTMIIAFWLAFTALQMLVCAVALRLDGEPTRDVWTLPLQQVVYRQLMYLVVIQSVASALAGTRTNWHKLRRIGTFAQSTDALPVD